MKLKIQIKNRWTGSVIFELETENNTISKTINEYVKQSRANLTDADLTDANLTRADLTDANLTDANLTRADLETIKYDFFGRMLMQKEEIPALLGKLIAGEINGSSYEGNCACFVGTVANAKQVKYTSLLLKPNSNSPTERWFLHIKEGLNPSNNNIAKITLDWIDEFLLRIKETV